MMPNDVDKIEARKREPIEEVTEYPIYESILDEPLQSGTKYLDYVSGLDQMVKPRVNGKCLSTYDENNGLGSNFLANPDPEHYTDLQRKEKSSRYQTLALNTNVQKLLKESTDTGVVKYGIIETGIKPLFGFHFKYIQGHAVRLDTK